MTTGRETLTQDIVDSIGAGITTTSELVALFKQTGVVGSGDVGARLSQLIKKGVIRRVNTGEYALVSTNGNGHHVDKGILDLPPVPSPEATNGYGRNIAENERRKVSIPEYMHTRNPITVFVERSPQEVEGVLRLELQVGGIWLPIQFTGDLRVCVGEDIPRYSASQETYVGVTAFRVTYKSGEQCDYAHNPKAPLTVDAK